MIEYDHRDQIPVLLLPSSHSRRKFIEGRWNSTFHFWGYRRRADRASVQLVCLRCMSPVWHETAALCVLTNVCSWWKSGHAADTTAKTGFDPSATSARFAVMHSGVRVQRCGNVRPLSLRKGLHEATRVHLAARRRGGVARRGRRVCPCGGSVC